MRDGMKKARREKIRRASGISLVLTLRGQALFLVVVVFATGTAVFAVVTTGATVAAFTAFAAFATRAAFAAGSALTLYVAFGLGLKGTH